MKSVGSLGGIARPHMLGMAVIGNSSAGPSQSASQTYAEWLLSLLMSLPSHGFLPLLQKLHNLSIWPRADYPPHDLPRLTQRLYSWSLGMWQWDLDDLSRSPLQYHQDDPHGVL